MAVLTSIFAGFNSVLNFIQIFANKSVQYRDVVLQIVEMEQRSQKSTMIFPYLALTSN